MSKRDYSYERNVWEEFFGPNKDTAKSKRVCDKEFKKLFPDGHQESIYEFLVGVLEKMHQGVKFRGIFSYLNDIHPRGLELICVHGRDYSPHKWFKEAPQNWSSQPVKGKCHYNSHMLMDLTLQEHPKSTVTYVEGIAIGPIVWPMLHAWNGKGFSKKAYDWTFYASTHWTRYYGIPFTPQEHSQLMEASHPGQQRVHLLFHVDHFEKVEDTLNEILAKPRRRFSRTSSTLTS